MQPCDELASPPGGRSSNTLHATETRVSSGSCGSPWLVTDFTFESWISGNYNKVGATNPFSY